MKEVTYNQVLNTYNSKEAGIKALSNYSSWFPVSLSPRLAGIVADLMGDGHLQKHPKWRVDYTSASTDELERFNKEIKGLFNISGSVRPCTTNVHGETFNLGVNCLPFGRLMAQCGVPRGSKVLIDFKIPKWITDDKECFRTFVRRLFDCEACVDLYSNAIEFRMSKEENLVEEGINFFNCIKFNLMKHFDINSTNPFLGASNKRKDGKVTRVIRIKIKNKAELPKFLKEIGFDSKEKQRKLMAIANK